ncbi:hypothetical protein EM595_2730 [Duffyella gerundensis]|uniref:Uncharacterized protein n=1 Tax=Duffyella gerundensis TaxID=1619313 RepID=A0A0U5GPM7_9GAMM|nr:hypothetical protein EM595_2730 [Duffyella gerundensis]
MDSVWDFHAALYLISATFRINNQMAILEKNGHILS